MSKELNEAVVVGYGRSAISKAKKGKGYFADTHPIEWSSEILKKVIEKTPGVEPEDIDDIAIGCARTVNRCGKNVARLVALRAGLESVSAMTVNRFCSSGLQTISICSNNIAVGNIDTAIAGGIECMSMTQTYLPDDDDAILDEMVPGAYMMSAAPLYHIGGLQGLIKMHLIGGTYITLNGIVPEVVFNNIEKYKVTQLQMLPPVTYERIYTYKNRQDYDLSSIWEVCVSAGKSTTEYIDHIFEMFPTCHLRPSCQKYSKII